MSLGTLAAVVDRLAGNAVHIAETTEHIPILVTNTEAFRIPNPQRGDASALVHAICERLRPQWAVFIAEAWVLLSNEVPDIVKAVAIARGVATVEARYRYEALSLYAEDDEGFYVSREYRIVQRAPGGVQLWHNRSGRQDDPIDPMLGAIPRMVPRRVGV